MFQASLVAAALESVATMLCAAASKAKLQAI